MAQSRNEEILEATLNHQEYDKPPQSREEELLIELKEAIEQGGGGGITVDPVPTEGSTNAVSSGGTYSALADKQNTIDSSHKLSADLIDDSTSTNKFMSAGDAVPTEDSTNPVSSGGVYDAIDAINNTIGDINTVLEEVL